MHIFVPHKNDKNIYFDEIISFSKSNFIFDDYKKYNNSYEIVNIHFPEAIFDWRVPTRQELDSLEIELKKWKKHSKVVYTMNDFKAHYDSKNEFLSLFKLIQKYCDGVIHLGNYSLCSYKSFFSHDCLHTIIYHPLYNSLLKKNNVKNVQEIVPISLENRFIVSVIGKIRCKKEMKLVLKIFRKIPVKNKILIAPRISQWIQIPSYVPFRFRKFYRKITEELLFISLNKQQYFFSGVFLDYFYLTDLLEKTSLLIIPRIENLNSGNLFLGLTFDKAMIIPKIGNLTEIANLFEFPLLDLKRNNFDEVINKTISFNSIKYFNSIEYINKKKIFYPEKIAENYDNYFGLLVQ